MAPDPHVKITIGKSADPSGLALTNRGVPRQDGAGRGLDRS